MVSVLYVEENQIVEQLQGVGDVNRDGFADFLVHTLGTTVIRLVEGPVPPGVVYLGDGTPTWTSDTEDFVVGQSSGPGDLDGDGFDDIVMTDSSADGSNGRALVFLGPTTDTSLDAADTILLGEDEQNLGYSAVATGDLDGGGAPDFVLSGRESSDLVLDHSPGTLTASDAGVYVMQGAGPFHGPMGATPVGDVNGDGWTDVAFGEINGGVTISVLYGPFGSSPTLDLTAQAEVVFYTTDAGGEGNLTVSTPLGDWGGDGGEWLAFGDSAYVTPEYRFNPICFADGLNLCPSGAVFIAALPIGPGVYDLDTVADRLEGLRVQNRSFARDLAGGQDLDDDGSPDLAILDVDYGGAFVVFGGGTW